MVIDTLESKITLVEVARQHNLTVAEAERWVEKPERNMEVGFRTRPRDVREQYEQELQQTRGALGGISANNDSTLARVPSLESIEAMHALAGVP